MFSILDPSFSSVKFPTASHDGLHTSSEVRPGLRSHRDTTDGVQLGSRQIRSIYETMRPWLTFYTKSPWAIRRSDPQTTPKFDLVSGNPFQMPLPEIASAFARASVPGDKDWFGYK